MMLGPKWSNKKFAYLGPQLYRAFKQCQKGEYNASTQYRCIRHSGVVYMSNTAEGQSTVSKQILCLTIIENLVLSNLCEYRHK